MNPADPVPAAPDDAPDAPDVPDAPDGALAVLFVCDRNAIRSPVASALARLALPEQTIVLSAAASTAAEEVDGFAVAVMAERGYDLAPARPQTLEAVTPDLEALAARLVIVALSAGAAPAARAVAQRLGCTCLHWIFSDPSEFEGRREEKLLAYRELRDALEARIRAELLPESPALPQAASQG